MKAQAPDECNPLRDILEVRNMMLLKGIRWPNCTLCELHKSSTNVCIMGKGNPLAKIMLIGEAPGEAESKTGQPFMGKAGQALDEWLRDLDLLGKVYITNVCKCRPPKNRKPNPLEVKTCTINYLLHELLIIKPQVVVCLGRTAINHIFTGRPFKRGIAFPLLINGMYPVVGQAIATWHPSYYNRLGGKMSKSGRQIRDEVIQSLSLARSIVNEIER